MSRFRWNNPKDGRKINEYIDYICKEFPTIAKGIVKHGIGDLNTWFTDGDAGDATCGCLIGTTALVAMKKMPKVAKKINLDTSDAAKVLYDIIVAKTKRDVSKYDVDNYSGYATFFNYRGLRVDPLWMKIHYAGILTSEEASEIPGADYTVNDWSKRLDQREKEVIDHIEDRIRRNLKIPYKKNQTCSVR